MNKYLSSSNRLIALTNKATKTTSPTVSVILSILFVIVLNLLGALAAINLLKILFSKSSSNPFLPYLKNFIGLIITFLPIILSIYFWTKFYEKRPFSSIGLEFSGSAFKSIKGALIGIFMLGCVFFLYWITGTIQISSKTFKAPAYGNAVWGAMLLILARLVQAGSEEVVFRGWLLPVLSKRTNVKLGIIISSLIFGLLHVFTNPTALAAINLSLYGAFLAIYALYDQSIWGVCAWHTAWNWTEQFVFGFSENGRSSDTGLFFNTQMKGSLLFTGGQYGTNSSIWLTVILTLAVLTLLGIMEFFPKKA